MPASRPAAVLNDSKKGYTLKEKFDILQYIVKQNAYNEVRGRSFWLGMEKSKITARTWQSLKEVFLKRILPDLRNPYYKLTHEQIRAFSTRSANTSKATKALNWLEKNKAVDKVLNRSMSDQNEATSPLNAKRKQEGENKQATGKRSPLKTNSTDTSSDSDIEFYDTPERTPNSQPSTSKENNASNNSRVTRNKDKENNVNLGSSQDSQSVESFPTNALLTSTPRKSLLRSSNLNSPQKNIAAKSIPSSPKNNKKTPVKESPKLVRVNNAAEDEESDSSKEDVIKKPSQPNTEKRSFSPNILLLSSSDSSLSEESVAKPQNKSKKNLFGFSSGKPSVSASQPIRKSSETDLSSEVIVSRPSTSNYVSPPRQNKLVNRQKSFIQGDSSDSDDEDDTSSDSQYTYYKNSDTESLKRKGKKMYGLFRGKLVPLYEPKKKCCIERKELIAKGKIVKKRTVHKGKGNVYIDSDFDNIYNQKPKNTLNGHLNDRGDNMLSKEILNFWKLKYLSLKRRNDEIMRLLAKQKNETYIDSVTKMLTDPISVPDKLHIPPGGTSSNNHLPSLLQGDNDKPSAGQLTKKTRHQNPDTTKQSGSGKKFVITSKSHNEPTTSKGVAESDNIVVIDSQKADIIIDILKKVSEMNRPIDPDKVNNLINSPATKSIVAAQQIKAISQRTRTPVKQTEKKINANLLNKNIQSKEIIPDEILKLREKEKQIFDKISAEKVSQESNTERDIFSQSELQFLFNEMEQNMSSGDKNHKKRDKDSSQDNKESNNPPKKLRSSTNNNTVESGKLTPRDAGTSTSNKNNHSAGNIKPVKSNNQTPRKSQSATIASLTEDTNYTLPESMDIGDDVKFAINPKFFSILFPDNSNKKEAKSNKSLGEVIPSSDNEFDESARYALPKSSSFNVKKNRRSTGKVIKLKMFTNLKKGKRQSFCENNGSLPNNEGSIKNVDSSDSSSTEEGSIEIPMQRFSLNSNIKHLENPSRSPIDLNKPLLEQSLENMIVHETPNNSEKVTCRFCDFSQQNVPESLVVPEILESVPLLDLPLNDNKLQQELIEEPHYDVILEDSQNETYFISCNTQEPATPQPVITEKEDEDISTLKGIEPMDTDSVFTLDISNTSLFNITTQSDKSDVEHGTINKCEDENNYDKQMIKHLMSEEESSD